MLTAATLVKNYSKHKAIDMCDMLFIVFIALLASSLEQLLRKTPLLVIHAVQCSYLPSVS